jgi:AraC-like DNA-binding protein
MQQIQTDKVAADQYPKIYLYRRIVQAKLFIDKFYSDKIDLDNISDEAYFSKFHFIRLFKSIYGKTPHQYLTKVRIDKAQQLLQQEKSVSEVCLLVGYDSISTFSGLFTKIVGKTPSDFLSDNRQRNREIKSEPLAFVPQCYAFMHGWTENSNFEEAKV